MNITTRRISSLVRGYLARRRIKKLLHSNPHILELEAFELIASAADKLPDLKEYCVKADALFISSNTSKYICYSSARTKVSKRDGKENDHSKIFLSVIANVKIVLNIFSSSNFTAETFVGQISFDYDDYFNQLINTKTVTKNLVFAEYPIFLNDSKEINIPNKINLESSFSIKLNLPSMFSNICGWVWDIKKSFFGTISREKNWVILSRNTLYCYDSPQKSKLLNTINCKLIKLSKKKFVDIEKQVVECLSINTEKDKYIWGMSELNLKGLWYRPLKYNTKKN